MDRQYPDILYVPEGARFDLQSQRVSWQRQGVTETIKLLPGRAYVRPSGYKVHTERPG